MRNHNCAHEWQNEVKGKILDRCITICPEIVIITFYTFNNILGKSDPRHFIFGFKVGRSRIRQTKTLNLNEEYLDRL